MARVDASGESVMGEAESGDEREVEGEAESGDGGEKVGDEEESEAGESSKEGGGFDPFLEDRDSLSEDRDSLIEDRDNLGVGDESLGDLGDLGDRGSFRDFFGDVLAVEEALNDLGDLEEDLGLNEIAEESRGDNFRGLECSWSLGLKTTVWLNTSEFDSSFFSLSRERTISPQRMFFFPSWK